MSAADSSQAGTGGFRRVGVLGGMFDPVHIGHVQAARSVRQTLGLDAILIVPCGNPVHRRAAQASAPERCAMLALALQGESGLQLDRRECQSPAPSYTIDTLRSLAGQQPGTSWHLLVGVDAFLGLTTWKDWQAMLDLVNLVVMTRPGHTLGEDRLPPALLAEWRRRRVEDAGRLAGIASGAMAVVDVKSADLSSTRVRELVKTGGDLGDILNPAVAAHIRTHGLYLPGDQD